MNPIISRFEPMPSWEDAAYQSTTYENDLLLHDFPKEAHDPLHESALPLLQFTHSELMTICMLFASILRIGKPVVKVLDIGGHVGRHFFNTKQLMGEKTHLDWTVLETTVVAEYGQKYIRSFGLKFAHDREWLHDKYDIVLASGSLQYIREAINLITEAPVCNSTILLINRAELIDLPSDVYYRNISIYDEGIVSFPARCFSKDNFLNSITQNHLLEHSWLNMNESSRDFGNAASYLGGFLLVHKNQSMGQNR